MKNWTIALIERGESASQGEPLVPAPSGGDVEAGLGEPLAERGRRLLFVLDQEQAHDPSIARIGLPTRGAAPPTRATSRSVVPMSAS